MKALIASLSALALVASPALATTKSHTTTKTVVTKGADEKATTTVTTKVTPVAHKGKAHARVKTHRHMAKAKSMKSTKTAAKAPAKTAKPKA